MRTPDILKELSLLELEHKMFLSFFKTRFPAFNNSNIFNRDFQHAVKQYFDTKGIKTSYPHSQVVSEKFCEFLIKNNILSRIDKNSMKINYEDFKAGKLATVPE